jgi:hypothetical protein
MNHTGNSPQTPEHAATVHNNHYGEVRREKRRHHEERGRVEHEWQKKTQTKSETQLDEQNAPPREMQRPPGGRAERWK